MRVPAGAGRQSVGSGFSADMGFAARSCGRLFWTSGPSCISGDLADFMAFPGAGSAGGGRTWGAIPAWKVRCGRARFGADWLSRSRVSMISRCTVFERRQVGVLDPRGRSRAWWYPQ